MDCPNCGMNRIPTKQTVPADKREDGRVLRKRTCKSCKTNLMTLEIPATELRALEQRAHNMVLSEGVGAPLPTSPTSPLLDLETALEDLLKPSLATLEEVLTSKKDVSRYKIDTARWIISDRREFRRVLASTSGADQSEDPAIAELASILSFIPEAEVAAQCLIDVCSNTEEKGATRLSAAKEILDRTGFKAREEVTVEASRTAEHVEAAKVLRSLPDSAKMELSKVLNSKKAAS